jgi:hypothetical protein
VQGLVAPGAIISFGGSDEQDAGSTVDAENRVNDPVVKNRPLNFS